jgi:dienelactone hydrolase
MPAQRTARKRSTAAVFPDYSPSRVHLAWMKEHPPALRFSAYGGDWRAWQRKLRRRVVELLGLTNMPEDRCPLRPRTLWRKQIKQGVIEKLVFTAEPGAEVPAYLCLPKQGTPPFPVFICLQGHSTGMHLSVGERPNRETPDKYAGGEGGDRDFALGCMSRGIAALCIEQRAFGERRERHVGAVGSYLTCHQAAMNALLIGRTLVGERVFDVDRGIDLLVERHRRSRGTLFDLSRVGVMGNSGGGLVSILAGAVLPRLTHMIPSCGFCTYRESIVSIQHCVDNFVPGILRYAEMADVLGLFAPRPVVVVCGRTDDIFPLPGVRRAFRQLKAIYTAAGAADRCKLVIGDGGHRFYREPAWRAMMPMLESSPA